MISATVGKYKIHQYISSNPSHPPLIFFRMLYLYSISLTQWHVFFFAADRPSSSLFSMVLPNILESVQNQPGWVSIEGSCDSYHQMR